jgi:hypothetical protein
MPNPPAGRKSPEQKAGEIADDFLNAELADDADARERLVKKITAALEEAEEAGYKRAMSRRF